MVLAAALLHGFSVCCGIELLTGLHEIALGYKDSWEKTVSSSSAVTTTTPEGPTLEYVCGSILDTRVKSWPSDADVVFCNTHCFDAEKMRSLSLLAGRLR